MTLEKKFDLNNNKNFRICNKMTGKCSLGDLSEEERAAEMVKDF